MTDMTRAMWGPFSTSRDDSGGRFRTFFETLERRVLFSTEAGELIDLAAGTTAPSQTELLEPQDPSTFVGPIWYPSASSTLAGPTVGSTPPGTPTPGGTTDNGTTPSPRPASDFRYVLKPGTGWTGPTPQPAPVGDPAAPGYDAKSIARWDVVPYQTFDGLFHVGVVAFHMNGIDRVDFSVNGGDWTAVRTMTLNPQTDVYEYTATLNASDFPDGPLEVRAIAWPTVGEPRVLGGDLTPSAVSTGDHSIILHADARHTLPAHAVYVSPNGSDSAGNGSAANPYKSIAKAARALMVLNGDGTADGGRIYLMAGEHKWGPAERDADGNYIGRAITVNRWLTIQAAPGLSQNDVALVAGGSGGLKTELTHISGVTIKTGIGNANTSSATKASAAWIDNSVFVGTGPTQDFYAVSDTGFSGGKYVTSSSISNTRYGFTTGINLLRNVRVHDTGDDAFVNPGLLVNARVERVVVPSGSGFHSDILQLHASATPRQNLIVYGLESYDSTSQGWHIGYTGHTKGPDWSDIALVNILLDTSTNYTSQWLVSANHVLWWHLTTPNQPTMLRNNVTSGGGLGEITVIRNYSLRNSVFSSLSVRSSDAEPNVNDPSWASGNHFMSGTAYGTTYTVGQTLTALFKDPDGNDFEPLANSILRDRTQLRTVPLDSSGFRRTLPDVGAREGR